MSDTLVFVTTHFLNSYVVDLWKILDRTDGIDAVLLVDNTNGWIDESENQGYGSIELNGEVIPTMTFSFDLHQRLKLPCIYGTIIGAGSTSKQTMHLCSDVSQFGKLMWWRGDFRFAYARHHAPNYKWYWQIENDCWHVSEDGTCNEWMLKWNSYKEDWMSYGISHKLPEAQWCFCDGMEWLYARDQIWKGFFAIVRMSRKLIDFENERAMELDKKFWTEDGKSVGYWPHCEAWGLSEAIRNGFSWRQIKDSPSTVHPWPKFKSLQLKNGNNVWLHPYKTSGDASMKGVKLLPLASKEKKPTVKSISIEQFL